MVRALLVLLLVAGGAFALVFGIDLNRQLEARLHGAVTALVLTISPHQRAAVVFWRLLALSLMIAGPSLLIFGAMVGISGVPGRKDARKKEPGKGAAKPKAKPKGRPKP
jgi:ABC-type transport system involved in multi-copper enzyme maturation permease subunit